MPNQLDSPTVEERPWGKIIRTNGLGSFGGPDYRHYTFYAKAGAMLACITIWPDEDLGHLVRLSWYAGEGETEAAAMLAALPEVLAIAEEERKARAD